MSDGRVTIKIPRAIYERVQRVVGDTGFRSATDFIVYVLRELLAEQGLAAEASGQRPGALTATEITAIRKRLKTLGYLE